MKATNISAKAFDLFCGIGGLSYGLQMAGIPVVAGLDIDSTVVTPMRRIVRRNLFTRILENSITQIFPLISMAAKYRILVGCAPCQPFSAHANKIKKNRKDARWNLIDEFLRFVIDGRPEIVSMENVPALRKEEIYHKFKDALKKLGYRVDDGIVPCEHFGLPQRRRRLVLLASLLEDIRLPEKSLNKPVTVRESIGHLRSLNNGEASTTDHMHGCWKLSPLNLKRIRASVPAGTWKDWPEELLPDCYRKSSGETYSSVYGRMSWDKPSPTLTTQFYSYGTGRFGHPEQDRALSVREGAILQAFPEDYKLSPPGKSPSISTIGRHIGNAVPPLLGKAIGKSITKHLENVDARL